MSLRRFYRRIDTDETILNIFFVLNSNLVNDECPICYEQINDGENIICHECTKPMHLSCIEKWFDTNEMRTCPHCRSKWKFEIDIIEKQKPVYVELDGHSEIPDYRRTHDNQGVRPERLTVIGLISGPITTVQYYSLNYSN